MEATGSQSPRVSEKSFTTHTCVNFPLPTNCAYKNVKGFLQHSNWVGREVQGREQEFIARTKNTARSNCSWVELVQDHEELVTAAVARVSAGTKKILK